MSREFLHGCLATAAIMAPSFAAVRTVRGRPAFMTTVDVTLTVSRRRCCTLREAFASDDSGQNNIALIPEQR